MTVGTQWRSTHALRWDIPQKHPGMSERKQHSSSRKESFSFKSHRGQRHSIGARIYIDPVSTLWSLGQWGCPSLTRVTQWKPRFSPSFPPCPRDPWIVQWKMLFQHQRCSGFDLHVHTIRTEHAEAPTGVQGLNREIIRCSVFFLSVWREKFPLNCGDVSVFGSVFNGADESDLFTLIYFRYICIECMPQSE